MKTQDGFTLMNKSEVKTYLAKQKVSRTINKLQVHHMDLPNYTTWEKTDKKVFDEPHFGRTQSLNDYNTVNVTTDLSKLLVPLYLNNLNLI